jgi:hypothetical protein
MIKEKGFEIIIASLPEYHRLVAEIYFNGKFFALLSNESPSAGFELKTPEPNNSQDFITRTIPLDGFVEILKRASQALNQQQADDRSFL